MTIFSLDSYIDNKDFDEPLKYKLKIDTTNLSLDHLD